VEQDYLGMFLNFKKYENKRCRNLFQLKFDLKSLPKRRSTPSAGGFQTGGISSFISLVSRGTREEKVGTWRD
jgi:hypothetical protein